MATGTRKRLLIVATTTGYQTKMFREAARRLGVDVSLATDRCHVLDDPWGDHAIPVRFEAPEESAAALAQGRSFDAVVAIGDRPAYLAALAAERLGVPFHRPRRQRPLSISSPPVSASARRASPCPSIPESAVDEDAEAAASGVQYPCVLKPLGLSTSRGVIRANSPQEFVSRFCKDPQPFKESRRCAAERPGLGLHPGGDLLAGARVRARRFGNGWALARAGVIR